MSKEKLLAFWRQVSDRTCKSAMAIDAKDRTRSEFLVRRAPGRLQDPKSAKAQERPMFVAATTLAKGQDDPWSHSVSTDRSSALPG